MSVLGSVRSARSRLPLRRWSRPSMVPTSERGLPDRHVPQPASHRHAPPRNGRRRAVEPGGARWARAGRRWVRCLGRRRVLPLRLRHQAAGPGPRGGPHLPALRQHHAVGARAAGQAVHGLLRADRPVGTPAARGLRDLRYRRRGLNPVASSPVGGRPAPSAPCVRDLHTARSARPAVLAIVGDRWTTLPRGMGRVPVSEAPYRCGGRRPWLRACTR